MKFKESKSIYLQIADRIMDEILRMVYPEEGRVPSVREYAAMVEVNANTVVRSYDYLQGQEIIYNKRGIGYFVSPGARERIIQLRRQSFLQDELPDMFRQIHLLGIPLEEIVAMYETYLSENGENS
jgi:GntR family transcriptional regulator